jgi:hypothetical protein
MSGVDDGGPAFPQTEEVYNRNDDRRTTQTTGGMSLRDYAAIKAMAAAMVNAQLPGITNPDPPKETMDALDEACVGFYRIADSMLKAREVK